MKMLKHKLLAAVFMCALFGAPHARAQVILLTPSTATPQAGVAFTLGVALDTGGRPVAGFSVYFNMAGTDPSGSFTVQSATLAPQWAYLSTPPSLGSALPNTGNSADYGNASTPDFSDLPAGANIPLFTLTLLPNASIPSGTAYTIQSTASSIFFYDMAGGGTEAALPAASAGLTVVPEPSACALLGMGLAATAWLYRRASSQGKARVL
jgi:hypothetical protein